MIEDMKVTKNIIIMNWVESKIVYQVNKSQQVEYWMPSIIIKVGCLDIPVISASLLAPAEKGSSIMKKQVLEFLQKMTAETPNEEK